MVGACALPGPCVRQVLRSLLASLVDDVGRTSFTSAWRGFAALGGPSGMAPLGPAVSKLDKLLASLRWQCSYVEDKQGLEDWLQQLCNDIQVGPS